MPFDFSALPIVDAHAHPFKPREKSIWPALHFVQ